MKTIHFSNSTFYVLYFHFINLLTTTTNRNPNKEHQEAVVFIIERRMGIVQ